MAIQSTPSPYALARSVFARARAAALRGSSSRCVVAALLGLVAAVLVWSGVTLADDATALARVEVQPFGGTLERVRAFGPDGRTIPLSVATGA